MGRKKLEEDQKRVSITVRLHPEAREIVESILDAFNKIAIACPGLPLLWKDSPAGEWPNSRSDAVNWLLRRSDHTVNWILRPLASAAIAGLENQKTIKIIKILKDALADGKDTELKTMVNAVEMFLVNKDENIRADKERVKQLIIISKQVQEET